MRINLNHEVMLENYMKEFPEWVNDNETKYDLCLTNDIDSLLSCVILNKIKGYEINLFYDFGGLYTLRETGNKAIGVDMDITKGKAWGNHVVKLSPHDNYNKEIANLNITEDISRKNYTKKYCGSTLLTIMSYYGVTIDNLSEEGKMILLAIDSTYLPFYRSRFKETGKKWLVNVLEYPELYEVVQRHQKHEFVEIIGKYGLRKPIYMVDERLQTEIDLEGISKALNGIEIELPNGGFTRRVWFNNIYQDLSHDDECYLTKSNIGNIFSLAVTYKHSISYSI
ncbi:hypothetical protein [Tissierella praeacuta]|uniref:hypothetical protein n=1 Tax=Tissierella praeacuta TaxID=43131 RepID=UPI003DA39E7E